MISFSFSIDGLRDESRRRKRCFRNPSTDTECDSESEDIMEGPAANEYKFYQSSHPDQLLTGMNDLRKQNEFCDVTIVVDGKKFPAHKIVLASFSPYFKAMFLSKLAESRQNLITLQGIDPDMMRLLLDYAYSSHVLITRSNVQSLLSAANLLQVLPVKEAACRFLENHMDSTNCLGIHSFAETHACIELQEKAKDYALQNFWEVFHQEEFLKLSASKLMELTSSDKLQVEKEEIVCEAIVRWHNYKPAARKDDFTEVLETVRLCLVSPYFLVDCIQSLGVVQENPECIKLVEEAKLYHLLPDRRHELSSCRSKPRLTSDTLEVIVAVGGEDDKVVLRAVECYCPSTQIWKALACLPFAISKHGLVASGKNTLYLAGGEFPDGGPSRCVWRYDTVLDYWQEMEAMIVPRSELGMAMLDGYVYAVGGWEGNFRLDSVERYDPTTNTWTLVTPMKTALTSAAVIAFDGMLYVTGQRSSPLHYIRRHCAKCTRVGGAILEEGDGIEMVQRYNPRDDSWSEMAPMKIARSGAAICTLGPYIYVVGGWHASTENTSRVERYNVKTDSWEFTASMNERRYRPGIAVMDGKIYILGGEEGWDRYHDTIECYDPETDVWTICGKMPSPRSWLGCVPLQVRKSVCREKS